MSKPGSPAGAVLQDICLSWPELAMRKTGDTEHREGGGEGRGRDGGSMTMSMRTENQDPFQRVGQWAREASQGQPLNLCF